MLVKADNIGLGVAALTAIQVLTISSVAKKRSRVDEGENYERLANTIDMAVANLIDGYFKELDAYIDADVMEAGDVAAAGAWLQAHEEIRSEDFDYIMLAGADGSSYNDNGSRTDIADRDYFKAIMQQGKARYVDNPVISKTTGKKVVHVAAPVRDGGEERREPAAEGQRPHQAD